MRTYAVLGIALLLLLLSTAFAQSRLTDKADAAKQQAACNEEFNLLAAAIAVGDWKQLDRLGERYNVKCIGVFGIAENATGHEQIASANVELGNFRKALTASERCVATYYATTGCHLSKARALIGLKRMTDAKASLALADKLIEHRIRSISDELAADQSAAKTKDLQSALGLLQAHSRLVASTRALHFE
jgi:hypothetical protein